MVAKVLKTQPLRDALDGNFSEKIFYKVTLKYHEKKFIY